jgi:hypothetical protein
MDFVDLGVSANRTKVVVGRRRLLAMKTLPTSNHANSPDTGFWSRRELRGRQALHIYGQTVSRQSARLAERLAIGKQ